MLGWEEVPSNALLQSVKQKAIIDQAFLRGIVEEGIGSVAPQAAAE